MKSVETDQSYIGELDAALRATVGLAAVVAAVIAAALTLTGAVTRDSTALVGQDLSRHPIVFKEMP